MGIHRATVVAVDDPAAQGRLQVTIPATGFTGWAARVVPIAAFTSTAVPIGAVVWVAYEQDDADLPVVLGLVDPPSRADALARDLEAMGDAWDHGHAAGAADATDAGDGPTSNPYR